ncbi:hypothetical protein N1028_03340 [Herbiconiux sp. CPCC 203407]|uniref:Uncharacterized protein n=1 Tax=Herbiconiux oxytropis TaxID=2970915 RepID=A0AA41XFW4_9MICO|nr:hypothetical protein [Herbiconiux oxytropis]MCS5720750.1 hypothetical protein [Herbiconiux oxytropis]MCS5724923.1 hypothetical protein [Herbiconiux oxytropis]
MTYSQHRDGADDSTPYAHFPALCLVPALYQTQLPNFDFSHGGLYKYRLQEEQTNDDEPAA